MPQHHVERPLSGNGVVHDVAHVASPNVWQSSDERNSQHGQHDAGW